MLRANQVTALDLCDSPPTPEIAKKLRGVVLTALSPTQLQSKIDGPLARRKIAAAIGDSIPLSIPEEMVVYRETTPFGESAIRHHLRQTLATQIASEGTDWPAIDAFDFTFPGKNAQFQLPLEPRHIEVHWPNPKIIGASRPQFSFAEKEGAPRVQRILEVEVTVKKLALEATRPITARERFTTDNARLVERVFRHRRAYEQAVGEEGMGSITSEGLASGSGVLRTMVDHGMAVRQFQTIPLVVDQGSVKITGRVTALESGRVGQSIRIKNNATKKELIGTIREDGSVALNL